MSNQLATRDTNIIEQVMMLGDLSKLTPEQRMTYYMETCKSIGLNPLTRPFEYITLNGKLTLYARKDAADQLRKLHGVSIDDINIRETDTQFVVTVKGHDAAGRCDVEVAVVNKADMRGDTANAQMKAVTKGKRRFTLSICGLGMLDETEVETIPNARPVVVTDGGEIVEQHPTHYHTATVEAVSASAIAMTLDRALDRRTKKGNRFGDLSREQLQVVVQNSTSPDDRQAAQMILDYWAAEPPQPEEPAE